MPQPLATALPVVETFHSLQGEGLHAGRSAFFIRLGGCAVACPWCDTKHSWPAEAHPQQSLATLAAETEAAAEAGAAFVVITGGEPLHHDLGPLCQALVEPSGLPLHLETSGVDPLSGCFAWITLSPKRHRPPTTELVAASQELSGGTRGRRSGLRRCCNRAGPPQPARPWRSTTCAATTNGDSACSATS